MDIRQDQLYRWITETLRWPLQSIDLLAADASFRRYFRICLPDKTLVAMDAPPEKEAIHHFIAVDQAFRQEGLLVPEIIAEDPTNGFLIISDLGDDLLLRILTQDNARTIYHLAIDQLLVIHQVKTVPSWSLPQFNQHFMEKEMDNFMDWFLGRYLQLPLTQKEENCLQDAFQFLMDSALEQPQVCTHLDYHSRNLTLMPNHRIGILDFQDAHWGPITYDVVSLLRDCYIQWPDNLVHDLLKYYFDKAKKLKLTGTATWEQFQRWFDLMGMQRHLKASFIFTRKLLRDDDPSYLDDVPRTLGYIQKIAGEYPELRKFGELFQTIIYPKFEEVYGR